MDKHDLREKFIQQPFLWVYRGGVQSNKSIAQTRHLSVRERFNSSVSTVNGLPVFLDEKSASKYGHLHKTRIFKDEIKDIGLFMNSKLKSELTGDTEELPVIDIKNLESSDVGLVFDRRDWNSVYELKTEFKKLSIPILRDGDCVIISVDDMSRSLNGRIGIEFYIKEPDLLKEPLY